MGQIALKNIKIYAYHGCLAEEKKIGSDYRIDLHITTNLEKPSVTDALSDTVDYVHLNTIIQEEMQIRSKLMEHVAERILTRILLEAQAVEVATIELAKINPPVGGNVEQVSVLKTKKKAEIL